MSKKQKKMLIRIIVALVVFIACEITEKLIHLNGVWDTVVKAAMFAVPYLMAGYDVLLKAIKNISKGHVFDENFLMAVATVGSLLSRKQVITGSGSGIYIPATIFFHIRSKDSLCFCSVKAINIHLCN